MLAPDGVGYISYNTYPGWKAREIIRDAMLLRGGALTAPSERVRTRAGMIDLLEHLIVRGQARFRLDPVVPEPTSTPPKLDEPARRLAELVRDDADPFVYNAWHESVALSATDRHLLPLLDGTRDGDALVDALLAATRDGFVQFERDGHPLSSEADVREAAEGHVDGLAQRLTEMKLWREVESRHSRFR